VIPFKMQGSWTKGSQVWCGEVGTCTRFLSSIQNLRGTHHLGYGPFSIELVRLILYLVVFARGKVFFVLVFLSEDRSRTSTMVFN
jgi:hypothetical protein